MLFNNEIFVSVSISIIYSSDSIEITKKDYPTLHQESRL